MRFSALLLVATIVSGPAIAADPVAAPAAAVAAAPAPDRSQEIICRREKETGSLVKGKKTCHSRAQWAYIDDENQRFSRNLVDDTRTKAGSN